MGAAERATYNKKKGNDVSLLKLHCWLIDIYTQTMNGSHNHLTVSDKSKHFRSIIKNKSNELQRKALLKLILNEILGQWRITMGMID